jgi:hypothetical protein
MNGQFQDYFYVDDPLGGVSTPGSLLISAFRPDISSWAELAALDTYGATLPVIIEWFDPTVPIIRETVLIAGVFPTDTDQGVQRPHDFDLTTNPFEWFQMAVAGS